MKAPISHILIPTDGSEFALKAAVYAGELARAINARVTVVVVHGHDVIKQMSWGANAMLSAEQVREAVEKESRHQAVADTLSSIGQQEVPPRVVQLWGHPAEQVVRLAEEDRADLIVMGSHGRSGFTRVLLGSVSNAVANHAHCPVLIVR